MIEGAVREKCGEERKDKAKMTVTMANLTPDDRDNKRRTAMRLYETREKTQLRPY